MLAIAGDNGLVAAWIYSRDLAQDVMPTVAIDRLAPPDLRARVLRSTGDTLTVQVDEGALPNGNELVYVERRGAFEVARREAWPEGRVLLTLAAWPRR